MNPQEEDGLLSSLFSKAMSGLNYVGGTLDKTFGGRAIRGGLGMLAGRQVPMSELLSIIPGSDTLGITDEANAVSGRDLNQNLGMDDDGWLGTVAGIGTEMALDPSTYIGGFGVKALTDAGKAAAKTGGLSKSLLGRIEAGQGGLLNVGLPFGPQTTIGTGDLAKNVAGKLGTAADWLEYKNPVGRTMGALFNADKGGATTEVLQRGNVRHNEEARKLAAQWKTDLAGITRPLADAGFLEGAGAADTSDAVRNLLEGVGKGVYAPDLVDAASKLKPMLKDTHQRALDIGIDMGFLKDYAPRQQTVLPKASPGYEPQYRAARGSLDPMNQNMIGRKEIFDGMSTGGINETVSELLNMTHAQGPPAAGQQTLNTGLQMGQHVRDKIGYDGPRHQALEAMNPPEMIQAPGLNGVMVNVPNPDYQELQALAKKFKQGQDFADWVAGSVDPQYATQEFFGNNVLKDVRNYGERMAGSQGRAMAIHEALAQAATGLASAGPRAEKLADVLASAGLPLNVIGGTTATGAAAAPTGALATIQKLLPLSNLDNLYVPRDVANDVRRSVRGFQPPEALQPALNSWDSLTNLTKAFQTAVWPAKHARDFTQGVTQNVFQGNRYGGEGALEALNPMNYIRPYLDAQKLRKGGALDWTDEISRLKGMTPEDATKRLLDEMNAHGTAGPDRMSQVAEIIGGPAGSKSYPMPGEEQAGLLEVLKGAIPKTWTEANPLNLARVGGSDVTQFAPVKAGAAVQTGIDELSNMSAFLAKTRQGFDPAQAAAEAVRAHYDYGNLTGFEREVMKRVMPFYSWQKQNVPAVARELALQPGGPVGQTIRATDAIQEAAGGDQGFVPEYLQNSLAIPLGVEADGTQRFLTTTEMNHEDAFKMLGRHGLGEATGLLNPILKYPVEMATGKQLKTGRELTDLHGPTGNTWLDNFLMNSPASRFYTSGRTLLDDRKGLDAKLINLASPGKVTDVQMDRQRAVAIRTLLEEALRGQPGVNFYERPVLKKGEEVDPQVAMLMELMNRRK